jgi:hypothetical protein
MLSTTACGSGDSALLARSATAATRALRRGGMVEACCTA